MYGEKTKNFSKKLTKELQKELSYVIDEIERETYWETRKELIDKVLKHIEIGDIKEYFEYLKNKGKPN